MIIALARAVGGWPSAHIFTHQMFNPDIGLGSCNSCEYVPGLSFFISILCTGAQMAQQSMLLVLFQAQTLLTNNKPGQPAALAEHKVAKQQTCSFPVSLNK